MSADPRPALRARGWIENPDGSMTSPRKKNLPAESAITAKDRKVNSDLLKTSAGISTDEAKLNKLERAFLAWLRSTSPPWIGIQCITLKLADDCRYTPDFWTLGCSLHAHEVKGFMRDDARVKLKVAARMYPMIQFTLVERIKGEWKFTDVKP